MRPSAAGDADSKARRRRPSGILILGMYDISDVRSAPQVRITMMTEALSRQADTERIVGGRLARAGASMRWLASGGPRRVGAVYVESATTNAMPTDLMLLALMRLLRKPVGVYFRDAYQLFRDLHPRVRRRQILTDWLWRLSTPLLKSVASVRYAPSRGLAEVLGLPGAVLLPPGTDPALPDLGPGEPDHVAAIVQLGQGSGLDQLLDAMGIVRSHRPAARLRIGTRSVTPEAAGHLPDWVEIVPTDRSSLVDLLRDARVCVLPLPINRYSNLAVAVRLMDFLGFGKPIVATDTIETRAILEASGAGIETTDTPEGLAGGILALLDDEERARLCSTNARAYSCSPTSTWDARASTVLQTLGLAEEPVS